MVNLVSLKMISFEKALNYCQETIKPCNEKELINLNEAHGRIIAKEIFFSDESPKINSSAMDGIAINSKDAKINHTLKTIGESKAGDKTSKDFKKGEALFIYTGAPIPGKNKIIIPKENFIFNKTNNSVLLKKIDKRNFIRLKGEDFKKNEICFSKNEILNIRSIALAKTAGFKKIYVKKKPNVYVILTGDEIISKKNVTGIIESSNEVLINMIIKKFGGNLKGIFTVKDNEKDFLSVLKKIKDYDLLITSGGISKGKYDIVKKTLKKINLKILFDQISMKPGKPTTFGRLDKGKYFLGLPGNPASCFISMLFFFSTFVNSFFGMKFIKIKKKKLKISHSEKKNNKLSQFLRIKVNKKNINLFKVYKNTDSSMQKILKDSDGILIRKPYAKEILKNSECDVILFNDSFTHEI